MTDSTNIVRLDEIAECVDRTIQGIRDGVALTRKAGINAELPEKVDFTMIVVKDWQALEVTGHESGKTTEDGTTSDNGKTTEKGTTKDTGGTKETQGGFNKETHTTGGTDRQTGTDTRNANGRNAHVQTTKDSSTSSES